MIQGICKYWHTIKITSFYHIFVITKLPLLIKNINHIIKKSHIYRRVFISPLTKTHQKKKKKKRGRRKIRIDSYFTILTSLCNSGGLFRRQIPWRRRLLNLSRLIQIRRLPVSSPISPLAASSPPPPSPQIR